MSDLDQGPDGSWKCPHCRGTGSVSWTPESKRRFLESLDVWANLRGRSNVRLADAISEIETYIDGLGLSPVVAQFLSEVWWRLQAADEPIEQTLQKIEDLSNDPEWLEKK